MHLDSTLHVQSTVQTSSGSQICGWVFVSSELSVGLAGTATLSDCSSEGKLGTPFLRLSGNFSKCSHIPTHTHIVLEIAIPHRDPGEVRGANFGLLSQGVPFQRYIAKK